MEDEEAFTREVVRLAGPEVLTCVQCGTCSSSCPTAHLMDNSIRKLVKLCLDGKKEEALGSQSLWLCTSCQLCTVRCPRGIRPKAVVAALKHIYELEGRKNKDQAFEEIFMRQIRECGRISEFLISAEYPLANPHSAVQVMVMGLELLPKGKISADKSCVKGLEEVRRIFEELE
jgi:heterodisulfide reductase subunit C